MIRRVVMAALPLVFAMMMAAACASTSPSAPSSENPTLPESSVVPESGSIPEESPDYLALKLQQILSAKLESAFSDSLMELLASRYSLSPRFSDIVADGDTFRAALLMENSGGQSYAREIDGTLSYNPEYLNENNFVANWGGICLVDPDTIAVITLDSVVTLDAHTLEEEPFPPDLSVLDENMSVVGVGIMQGEYLVATVTRVPGEDIDRYEESFLLFDQNGTLTDTVSIGTSYTFSRYHSQLERELLYADQIFTPIWDNERFVVIPSVGMASSLDSSAPVGSLFAARYDSGDDTLLIADIPGSENAAFLYEQSELTYTASLPVCHPGLFVRDEWNGEKSETVVSWNENRAATITNPYFDTTITLDFEAGTADAIYSLNPEHIRQYDDAYPPPTSPDGRYRMIEASSQGWDAIAGSYANVWLHDTVSEQYQFFDIFTSSYGGYGDRCKFFESTRFFRMDFPGQLTVYDIVDSRPELRLSLSDNAIAVTYAADRGYFYVLEMEGEIISVAIWDESGSLIDRRETAIPVTHHFEGYYSPAISVSGDVLYYESPHMEERIKGQLDLTTFAFTETSREPLRS